MRYVWIVAAIVFGGLSLGDGGISGAFLVFALFMSVYYLDDIATSLRILTRELEGADKWDDKPKVKRPP